MKLDAVRFGIAWAIIAAIFIIIVDVSLWIKFVPSYNDLLINVYGLEAWNIFDLIRILFFSVIVASVIGFVLTWLSAKIYNRLLTIKLRE